MRLSPDPVINGGHFDVADLVFVIARGRLQGSFGMGLGHESEGP